MRTFSPFADDCSQATRDGRLITGTLVLRSEAKLKILSAEVQGDGQFLVCVFEEVEEKEGDANVINFPGT